MKRAGALIAAACSIDILIGDPRGLPHPVRAMGAAIDWGERRLNAGDAGSATAGALLALSVIAGSALAGVVAQRSSVAAAVLGASTLAARDLLSEAASVATALERGELAVARARVARIVGRDTAELSVADVARATIETLAESACDGIVAPLFWLMVAGLPGALAFKAASTLDSMIGHREPRFLHFGAFAARTDDALNFLPARIAAALIALAGGSPLRALVVMQRDAAQHASPNAGWPEAALAGTLDVRLGGPSTYGGVAHDGPVLNSGGHLPTTHDIRRAMRIVAVTTFIAAGCAVALRA